MTLLSPEQRKKLWDAMKAVALHPDRKDVADIRTILITEGEFTAACFVAFAGDTTISVPMVGVKDGSNKGT